MFGVKRNVSLLLLTVIEAYGRKLGPPTEKFISNRYVSANMSMVSTLRIPAALMCQIVVSEYKIILFQLNKGLIYECGCFMSNLRMLEL